MLSVSHWVTGPPKVLFGLLKIYLDVGWTSYIQIYLLQSKQLVHNTFFTREWGLGWDIWMLSRIFVLIFCSIVFWIFCAGAKESVGVCSQNWQSIIPSLHTSTSKLSPCWRSENKWSTIDNRQKDYEVKVSVHLQNDDDSMKNLGRSSSSTMMVAI